MRRLWICLAIGGFLLGETGNVPAQTGVAQNAPSFSANERAIIARNEALSIAMTVDPDVVRRILDEIAQPKPGSEEQRARKRRDVFGNGGAAQSPLDGTRNPDLDVYLQRASPEAAYDLLQILKRVGAAGGPKR